MIRLIKPHPDYLQSVLKGIEEYESDTTAFHMIRPVHDMIEAKHNHFKDYFNRLNNEENGINLQPNHVKQTTFWLLDDVNMSVRLLYATI